MFKKIIVPVDGSEPSWQALKYAVELSGKFDGELLIFHIIQPLYDANLLDVQIDGNLLLAQMDDLKQNAGSVLDSAKEKIAGLTGKFTTRTEFGHPAECIIKLAAETGSDAIVIGSRGLSGITEFVLGSVSSSVAHKAKVPVLIVKGPDETL